ncbi:MAG: glycosyltransferase family 9 protein [Gammaproteobacteria bacterium]|nr:glycosyltransferase family 9 protein [Gammaproteobacteria bacterium]
MTPTKISAPSFLVIRRDNIGDLACTTPLIHALRQHFPQARVCVLVNSYNRPVVENNPDIDAIYAYMKTKHRAPGQSIFSVLWKRVCLMRELRRQHFDYAIIAGAHFLPRALRLARALKPKHIVGFTEPGKRGAQHIDTGVAYTLPHPLHEAQDVFRLLAPLGIDGEPPVMRVFPAASALVQVSAALQAKNISPHNLIGVHISARKPTNRWPAEKFIALIKRLHPTRASAFVLFWSPGSASNPLHPGDDEKAEQIMQALHNIPILAYPTDRLDQLIAGLSLCRSIVCSDGGAMHLAAALGKPILCFFGKSDKTRWYPWKAPHILLQPASLNVADIGVDEAVSAFERLTVLSDKALTGGN